MIRVPAQRPAYRPKVFPNRIFADEEARPVIFGDVTATVGRTPLVELVRLAKSLPGRTGARGAWRREIVANPVKNANTTRHGGMNSERCALTSGSRISHLY
jgi:hypothetical protein